MVATNDAPSISSRLIFRNLPSTLTPPSLREHLTHPASVQTCDITDLRLVPKRRFAFVGYKTEDEARRAKEYFDGSFLGSGRVKVDYVQDDTLSLRPEIKAKPNTPAAVTPPPATNADKPFSELAEPEPKPKTKPTGPSAASKRLEEFMQVMKGTSDDGVRSERSQMTDAEREKEAEKAKALLDEKDGKVDDEAMDDAEWLRRRQQRASGIAGVEDVVSGLSTKPTIATTSQETAFATATATTTTTSSSPEESQIITTARLFIRNLSFLTTSSDLSSLLTPFGPISEIHIPLSTTTKQPLGTAFAQFLNPVDAVAAWKRLDGKTFMGRLLHVLPGRAKMGESGVLGVVPAEREEVQEEKKGLIGGKVLGKESKNVKSEVAKRQREATGKGLNWASLYMNSDAVVSSIADRMGIQKADILNSDSTTNDTDTDGRLSHMGSAVKLALAETSIIAETKKYFEDHGVLLDTLSQTSDGATASGSTSVVRTPRSKTVLLVKNIPYGTTMEALTALFSPHGELQRVLMPPAGTLAVVEFEEEDAASRAFKAVSYRRLGNAVIYLEKAPTGLISSKVAQGKDVATVNSEVLERVQNATARQPGEEDPDAEAGSTLYVKNLAFETTTEKLNSVFAALPAFAFARVSTKPDAKNPTGPRLSMGFGFVGFKTKDAAGKALEGLKGFKLDGHVLEFKWAQRDQGENGAKDEKGGKAGATTGGGKKSKTTKMIVKNLPFEASKKDIRDLFSTFGTLKSCRLPKKHNSSGRGFAFLDFSTRQEAESAMEALKHTHLLGRHLVLEWAADEEDIAEAVLKLRTKTKLQFAADGEGGERKRKKLDLKGDGEDRMDAE